MVVLEYDSDYAANCIQRLSRPRTNLAVIIKGRVILDTLVGRIKWVKVESHTHQLLNDRADSLAKCGAAGIARGMTTLMSTPALFNEDNHSDH